MVNLFCEPCGEEHNRSKFKKKYKVTDNNKTFFEENSGEKCTIGNTVCDDWRSKFLNRPILSSVQVSSTKNIINVMFIIKIKFFK